MRTRLISLTTGALLLSTAPAISAMAATEPKVGSYLGYEYFVSTTCANNVGIPGPADGSLVIHWPGPAANGFTIYGSAKDATSVKLDYFPVTPAVGVTSWSGTRVHYSYPPGTKAQESFSATITYINPSSFLMTLTHSAQCGNGKRGTAVSNFTMMGM